MKKKTTGRPLTNVHDRTNLLWAKKDGKTIEIIEIWRTKTNEATYWANRLETAVSVNRKTTFCN